MVRGAAVGWTATAGAGEVAVGLQALDPTRPTAVNKIKRNLTRVPSVRAAASVANDLPLRQAAVDGEILLQPFRKSLPCASARDFDRGATVGIAQTHKSEVKVQRVDKHLGEPGDDRGRFSADPRRRDGRQCHEVPKRCSQPQCVSLEAHRCSP